ncbi:MAG: HEAT repeat domain-containing protein [Planctomycetota bacterium]
MFVRTSTILAAASLVAITAVCSWAVFDKPGAPAAVDDADASGPGATRKASRTTTNEAASAPDTADPAAASSSSVEARLARLEADMQAMMLAIEARDREIAALRGNADAQAAEGDSNAEFDALEWADDAGKINPAQVISELLNLRKQMEDLQGSATTSVLREFAMRRINMNNGPARFEAMRDLAKLSQEGDPAASEAVMNYLKADDAGVRRDAAMALGQLRNPEWGPALIEATSDGNAAVRAAAADALGRLPGDVSGDTLMSLIDDRDRRVRVEVIQALGDTGQDRALPQLSALSVGKDRGVAYHAAVAMRKLGDPSAARAMAAEIGERVESTNVGTRRYAVAQLAQLRVEDARPFLEQAKSDRDWNVRNTANRALRALDQQRQ